MQDFIRAPGARLAWLNEASRMSTQELIELEGTYRLDQLADAFEQGLIVKVEAGVSLTPAERVVLVIGAIEREVNNGGFSQLFANSSRQYVGEFVSASRAIGRPDVADLAQKAIDALSLGQAPTPESARRAALEADARLEQRLDDLDKLYYAAQIDMAPDVFAFIKANAHQIGPLMSRDSKRL